jgi:protein-L-isoaspartate(D-aspartate) O-methyltransferase
MTDKYGLRERGLADERVLAAMERVPREAFVPPEYLAQALEDHPLPIGQGQTISQPYMVAAMSELLHLTPASRVLEIGTGSGFQTAVLAELAAEVYSVEILPELQSAARARLARLGYRNIRFRLGDGYDGWAEFAPYDGILVTSAPEHVPPPLKAQLADGARLIIPVGPAGGDQILWQVRRDGERYVARRLMSVAFVPFMGRRGRTPLLGS